MAKYLTLAILAVAFIVGCVGAFLPSVFGMEDYKTFLNSFSPFYLGLIVSIGANSAVGKIQNKKADEAKEE